MPTEFEVDGMRFVINTREAENERPHFHVYTGHGRSKKDAKIWLDTLRAAYWGAYTRKEQRKIREIAPGAKRTLLEAWRRVHGKPKLR